MAEEIKKLNYTAEVINDKLAQVGNRTTSGSSMGYVVLDKNKPFAEQVTTGNTIYEIRDSFDLGGAEVAIPESCVLKFNGGSIGGRIKGNNTSIDAPSYKIFQDVNLLGSWRGISLQPEWFGAKIEDSTIDNALYINMALQNASATGVAVRLESGKYYTNTTINIDTNGRLIGSGKNKTYIVSKADVGIYIHGQRAEIEGINLTSPSISGTGIKCGIYNGSETAQGNVSWTRGGISNIAVSNFNVGIDLGYQWCNVLRGINSSYNNIGIKCGHTTPYLQDLVIEANREYGIICPPLSAGVKIYNAVIEGNLVGLKCDGGECMLINCYFEGNTGRIFATGRQADWTITDDTATYNGYSWKVFDNGRGVLVDKTGGHIYVGEEGNVTECSIISCHIVNTNAYNNNVKIDNCKQFSLIGSGNIEGLIMTEKCHVLSLPGMTGSYIYAPETQKTNAPTFIFHAGNYNLFSHSSGYHRPLSNKDNSFIYTGGCNFSSTNGYLIVTRNTVSYRVASLYYNIKEKKNTDVTLVIDYEFEENILPSLSFEYFAAKLDMAKIRDFSATTPTAYHIFKGVKKRGAYTFKKEDINSIFEQYGEFRLVFNLHTIANTEQYGKEYDDVEGYRMKIFGIYAFEGNFVDDGINFYNARTGIVNTEVLLADSIILPEKVANTTDSRRYLCIDPSTKQIRVAQSGKYTDNGLTTSQINALPTNSKVVGLCIFNSTLKKPVWWDGNKWVDATGADV